MERPIRLQVVESQIYIVDIFQTEGKKNNIRALLCSMHAVLWPDAKWQKCEMHQLVSATDVKKAYRKACLAVHPDKVHIDGITHLLAAYSHIFY